MMTENFELDDACIVEQCYVLLGIKPDQNSLLISALQCLVDFEEPVRTSTWNALSILKSNLKLIHALSTFNLLPVKERFCFWWYIRMWIIHKESALYCRRISSKLCVASNIKVEPLMVNKRNESIALDLKFSFPSIPYSLRLPQISNEWGVA